MYTELLEFLESEDFFIEAEAKTSRMRNFINSYNHSYNENLSIHDDGIILLQEDADKWGLELRVYIRTRLPENVRKLGFAHNETYRNDFSYRLNSNEVVKCMFEHGYRIGMN